MTTELTPTPITDLLLECKEFFNLDDNDEDWTLITSCVTQYEDEFSEHLDALRTHIEDAIDLDDLRDGIVKLLQDRIKERDQAV